MAGYGSKSSDIKEGANLGVGIHSEIFLKEVKAHTTEPNKKDEVYEVLDFTFKNSKGDSFQYRIFNPEKGDKNDTTEKLAKAQEDVSNKVVYIAAKVSGKEVELNGDNINNWEDFTRESIALLPPDYSTIPLQIKLIGNAHNSKTNVQAPNLFKGGWIGGGWIRRMDSKVDKPLVFSPQDIKGNMLYESFVRKPSNTGSSDPLPANTGSEPEELIF